MFVAAAEFRYTLVSRVGAEESMVGVAQLVSAPDCGSGGRGFESLHPPHFSSPRAAKSCIIRFRCDGPLAQLAEQGTLNPKVRGSNPRRSTIKIQGHGHFARDLSFFESSVLDIFWTIEAVFRQTKPIL